MAFLLNTELLTDLYNTETDVQLLVKLLKRLDKKGIKSEAIKTSFKQLYNHLIEAIDLIEEKQFEYLESTQNINNRYLGYTALKNLANEKGLKLPSKVSLNTYAKQGIIEAREDLKGNKFNVKSLKLYFATNRPDLKDLFEDL